MATRGVPRDRLAISSAPEASSSHVENLGGAHEDLLQLRRGIKLQAKGDAEAIPQGKREQAGARRGSHQGERRDVELDGAGAGPLADEDVDLEILHRRVEDLFHHVIEAVDLIDEENVVFLEVAENRGQIPGAAR